jgi:hypothetical protein
VSVPAADELRGYLPPTPSELLAAADLLDAIDALHQPISDHGLICDECDHPWPCPTARLLHPDDGEL